MQWAIVLDESLHNLSPFKVCGVTLEGPLKWLFHIYCNAIDTIYFVPLLLSVRVLLGVITILDAYEWCDIVHNVYLLQWSNNEDNIVDVWFVLCNLSTEELAHASGNENYGV